jgi:hypothetical protein
MNPDELIVNIQCVEYGIVPIAGIPANHVEISLSGLSLEARRKCTRKFRKILKRAIKYLASEYYSPGSPRYDKFIQDYRKLSGLNKSSGSLFSREERGFRQTLVVKYLRKIES